MVADQCARVDTLQGSRGASAGDSGFLARICELLIRGGKSERNIIIIRDQSFLRIRRRLFDGWLVWFFRGRFFVELLPIATDGSFFASLALFFGEALDDKAIIVLAGFLQEDEFARHATVVALELFLIKFA